MQTVPWTFVAIPMGGICACFVVLIVVIGAALVMALRNRRKS